MSRIVNVHHVDFAAFMKGDVDYVDPEEIVMVFESSPSFADVMEKVRSELNWMEKSDVVELKGRYNVGFDHYIRWKMMPLDNENRWQAYKEVVLNSQDKSLELFARRKVRDRGHIDLNQQASASDTSIPVRHDEARVDPEPEEYDTTMSQPPMTQPMSPVFNNHYDGHQAAMEGDESDDDESTGDDGQGHETEAYLHNHDVGDVEANCYESDMDHDTPYARSYAIDSEDEGPEEEIDEDGLTAKEARAFMRAFGRDHRLHFLPM